MLIVSVLAALVASGACADPFSELGIPTAPPWQAPADAAAARPAGKETAPEGAYEAALSARLGADLEDALSWRGELESILRYAAARPQVFPAASVPKRELFDEYHAEAQAAWSRAADLLVALDRLAALYGPARLSKDPAARRQAQALAALVSAARCRFVRAWGVYAGRDEALKELFDAARPELGLPQGAWSRLSARCEAEAGRREADSARAAWETAGGERAFQAAPSAGPELRRSAAAALSADLKVLGARPARRGSAVPPGSLAALFKHLSLSAVAAGDPAEREPLPVMPPAPEGAVTVSSRVAYAVGTFRHWFQLDASTAAAVPDLGEIRLFAESLRPGDIILTRSLGGRGAVGQGGWWDGAGLYAGGDVQRRSAFGDDSLSAALRAAAPAMTVLSTSTALEDLPSVVSASRSGVSVRSLSSFCAAEAVAALRPVVPGPAKSAALLRAARLVGRPYDPAQDPAGTARVSEGELLAAAYEGALAFDEEPAAGRRAASPGGVARAFDARFGTPGQRFEFVAGIDRGPASRDRRLSVERFRESARRSRWDLAESEEKAP